MGGREFPAGLVAHRQASPVQLGADAARQRAVLRDHLEELAQRIAELQAQQQRVIALLGLDGLSETPRLLTREAMVAIFRSAGLDDEGMDRLHVQFERTDPAAHQRFLESLGLGAEHIARVRRLSREA